MSNRSTSPPPRSSGFARGCLLALLVVIGIVLLLPGICSAWFISAGASNGLAVLGILVSMGGMALIVYAVSAVIRG